MSLKIINGAENYCAKVVRITTFEKHPNADKLWIVNIGFNKVITGVQPQEGQMVVYFPVLSKLNSDFISKINGFRHSELNINPEVKGFFEDNGRVKPIKLRGMASEGYIHPLEDVASILGTELKEGDEFNAYNDYVLCTKYIIKVYDHQRGIQLKQKNSRILEGQFRFHEDTSNLRNNMQNISPIDIISIHYKKHGTSWVVGNVLVKRKLNVIEKLLKFLGAKIKDKEYDIIYSSRKVIKNADINKNQNHYFGYDLWEEIKNEVSPFIPKGFTLYGEAVGFDKNGTHIQKGYDYGHKPSEDLKTRMGIWVYRITYTNEDGMKFELTDKQIKEFCNSFGLNYEQTFFYYGKAKDLFPDINVEDHWHELFMRRLEKEYTEKNCFMCVNKVPEEGIILRKENFVNYTAYKLKSFAFLEQEDKLLDLKISNIEDEQ